MLIAKTPGQVVVYLGCTETRSHFSICSFGANVMKYNTPPKSVINYFSVFRIWRFSLSVIIVYSIFDFIII